GAVRWKCEAVRTAESGIAANSFNARRNWLAGLSRLLPRPIQATCRSEIMVWIQSKQCVCYVAVHRADVAEMSHFLVPEQTPPRPAVSAPTIWQAPDPFLPRRHGATKSRTRHENGAMTSSVPDCVPAVCESV